MGGRDSLPHGGGLQSLSGIRFHSVLGHFHRTPLNLSVDSASVAQTTDVAERAVSFCTRRYRFAGHDGYQRLVRLVVAPAGSECLGQALHGDRYAAGGDSTVGPGGGDSLLRDLLAVVVRLDHVAFAEMA